MLARLFLISPLWAAYFFHETYNGPMHEQMSFSTLLICSVVAFVTLCWWDSGRAPRSAISVILRNMAITSGVVWSFLLLFGVSWHFWYLLAHATVWVTVFWQLVTHGVAHHFLYPFADPNYHAVREAGWHPFWDVTAFNTDSELIRDGGFEEPVYTGFVPPADWRFQCPVCGARQPTDFGVCWACGYGADGDDTAYYRRWGSCWRLGRSRAASLLLEPRLRKKSWSNDSATSTGTIWRRRGSSCRG